MKNEKKKFKTELKYRIYVWRFCLIKFLEALAKDTITQRLVDPLFLSDRNIGAIFKRTDQGCYPSCRQHFSLIGFSFSFFHF